jgi:hypothetical protein
MDVNKISYSSAVFFVPPIPSPMAKPMAILSNASPKATPYGNACGHAGTFVWLVFFLIFHHHFLSLVTQIKEIEGKNRYTVQRKNWSYSCL